MLFDAERTIHRIRDLASLQEQVEDELHLTIYRASGHGIPGPALRSPAVPSSAGAGDCPRWTAVGRQLTPSAVGPTA